MNGRRWLVLGMAALLAAALAACAGEERPGAGAQRARPVGQGGEGGGGGAGGAAGGTAPRLPRTPGGVERALYDADFVLAHAREIGMDPEVESRIRADLARTQARWDAAETELRAQTAELEAALAADPIDEATAAREAADVIRIEGELKQDHLALRVRIRNALRPEQRAQLDRLRAQ